MIDGLDGRLAGDVVVGGGAAHHLLGINHLL